MSNKTSILGISIGLIGGVGLLYAGVLISTLALSTAAFFALPVPILLATITLGITYAVQSRSEKYSMKTWSSFAIALVVSFVITAGVWVYLISPYGTLV